VLGVAKDASAADVKKTYFSVRNIHQMRLPSMLTNGYHSSLVNTTPTPTQTRAHAKSSKRSKKLTTYARPRHCVFLTLNHAYRR
jgi:hypothetical protein